MNRSLRRVAIFVALSLAAGSLGCASQAWKAALREDTPAAYYRFMRDHEGSKRVADAQEHLDYHQLKRKLSIKGFEAFDTKYPGSALAAELRPMLEPLAFQNARAQGTAAAYREFLAQFPAGEWVARAEGNIVYVTNGGFGGSAKKLAAFASEHPESDFAPEARRSVDGIAIREKSRFNRVAFAIEIDPSTPEKKRLRKAFEDRTRKIYERSNIHLVVIPPGAKASAIKGLPKARLTISHGEKAVRKRASGGDVSQPGRVARTVVSLVRQTGAPPIFEREFTLRVGERDHLSGSSVLFSASAPYYWDSFFVPLATWQSSVSLRPPVALSRTAVAVDAANDRSVVLYDDGSFELIELADPKAPVVLLSHQRPKDFKKWSGVKILGDRVAIFGEEGIEFVRFGENGPELAATYSRGDIGTVAGIAESGGEYMVASTRGLLVIPKDGGAAKRVMRRVLKGIAMVGETLVFSDGETVFFSNRELVAQKRVTAKLPLGKAFGPARIGAFGSRVIVLGRGGVVVMDVSKPAEPRTLTKLHSRSIGHVTDATAIGGRIFLLGDRGLQMLDARGSRVVESVDVRATGRAARMGRHLVAVGHDSLQVVDSTPFTARSNPASPQKEAAK